MRYVIKKKSKENGSINYQGTDLDILFLEKTKWYQNIKNPKILKFTLEEAKKQIEIWNKSIASQYNTFAIIEGGNL